MMPFSPRGPLRGTAAIPGDKSISHRALMLAALAVGESRIVNLNPGGDVAATAAALRAMGARIERRADGAWIVHGVGVGGLLQPEAPLDCGNSGTTARLLIGLVASHPIRAVFTGDASLRRRPMARVADPLRRIGARIAGDRLPLLVEGLCPAAPARHRLELASAQVKSALLLAGLNTPGVTELIETAPARDHTVRLLKRFGAAIEIASERIALSGEAELKPQSLQVPGDLSAAAFLIVAALVVPGSDIRLEGVGVNPRRAGLLDMLTAMGGDIVVSGQREQSGEPVADLAVRHSALRAIDVPPEIAPRMIDEYPALCVAAAFARGTTRMRGLAELRVKESDRLAAMAPLGAAAEGDGLAIVGSGGAALAGGFAVDARLDHRIAMAYAVAGLASRKAVGVAGMDSVATSFPGFLAALDGLTGA
jgi:3-phosphoshikimate 1-carboxyvinyltransferase